MYLYGQEVDLNTGPSSDNSYGTKTRTSTSRVSCTFIPGPSAHQKCKDLLVPMGLPQLARQVLCSHFANACTCARQGFAGADHGQRDATSRWSSSVSGEGEEVHGFGHARKFQC